MYHEGVISYSGHGIAFGFFLFFSVFFLPIDSNVRILSNSGGEGKMGKKIHW